MIKITKLSVSIGFLFVLNFVNAQTPQWEWIKSPQSAHVNSSKDITTDTEGNVYLTGSFTSPTLTFGDVTLTNSGGGQAIFLAKYDSSGNTLWAKAFTGDNFLSFDEGMNVATDAENNVYINGYFRSSSLNFDSVILNNNSTGTNNSIFIAKFDSEGGLLWVKSTQGRGYSTNTYGLEVDSGGNVVMAGTFETSITFGTTTYTNSEYGTYGTFLVKYDPAGNIIWSRGLPAYTGGQCLAIDDANNIYTAGKYIGSPSYNVVIGSTAQSGAGVFFVKYDSSGNAIWVKTVNKGLNVMDMALDSAGNIISTGDFTLPIVFDDIQLTSNNGTDMFIVKHDNNGNALWADSAGGIMEDKGSKVATDSQDNIYLSGNFKSNITFGSIELTATANYKPVFIAKYNSDGDNIWAFKLNTVYGSSSLVDRQAITVDLNDDVYIGGVTSNNTSLGNVTVENGGIFVGKLQDVVLSVNEDKIPGIKLYPNPVNDIMTIDVYGDLKSVVIYNPLGQKIKTSKSATAIDMSDLESGYYIAEIITDIGSYRQKVIKN